MKVCEVCGARYKGSPRQCPLDGGRLTDLPDPMLGQTVGGRYLVAEKLGGGGMGVVYRARQVGSLAGHAPDVAIKFLLPELAVDPIHRQRFLREAKAANQVDHDNIIDVADFGEDAEHVYLVMELLRGSPLGDVISEEGPLGVARSLDIAMQCASALARAHELDVVHRDIKPDNIYLLDADEAHPDRRDFVKILDFGLAHMKGELRLTASGAVFGTPEYMAPEQARGAPLTGLADLYALGCVLFEMLAGVPPFAGTTPDLILKHMREPAPSVASRAAGVPATLDAVVKRLLEKDPKKRHRDAYHLLEELRQVRDALPRLPAGEAPALHSTLVHAPSALRARERLEAAALPASASGPVLPEGWEGRVALFRELVPRAYPGRLPPQWLVPAIDELGTIIERVRAIEREQGALSEQAVEREAGGRNVRLRLGRAIDELGRDESRALRRLEELGVEIERSRRALVEAERSLTRLLGSLGALGSVVTPEVVAQIRHAGLVANGWIEAEARIQEATAETRRRERERDDLRFQISQLKGRMGSLGVDDELDLGALRERALRLEREREALVEDVQGRASGLLQHFAGFPELEDAVRQATIPAPSRSVARR